MNTKWMGKETESATCGQEWSAGYRAGLRDARGARITVEMIQGVGMQVVAGNEGTHQRVTLLILPFDAFSTMKAAAKSANTWAGHAGYILGMNVTSYGLEYAL